MQGTVYKKARTFNSKGRTYRLGQKIVIIKRTFRHEEYYVWGIVEDIQATNNIGENIGEHLIYLKPWRTTLPLSNTDPYYMWCTAWKTGIIKPYYRWKLRKILDTMWFTLKYMFYSDKSVPDDVVKK